ncbi:hypothetical protein HDV62DRAFT_127157 [Trichoderma sp. SZMC 28011]
MCRTSPSTRPRFHHRSNVSTKRVHGTCWLPCNFDMSCRHSGLHDVFLVLVKDKEKKDTALGDFLVWNPYPAGAEKKAQKNKKETTAPVDSKKQARHTKRRAIPDLSASPLVASWLAVDVTVKGSIGVFSSPPLLLRHLSLCT